MSKAWEFSTEDMRHMVANLQSVKRIDTRANEVVYKGMYDSSLVKREAIIRFRHYTLFAPGDSDDVDTKLLFSITIDGKPMVSQAMAHDSKTFCAMAKVVEDKSNRYTSDNTDLIRREFDRLLR